jgi:hypothetical protein
VHWGLRAPVPLAGADRVHNGLQGKLLAVCVHLFCVVQSLPRLVVSGFIVGPDERILPRLIVVENIVDNTPCTEGQIGSLAYPGHVV